MWQVTVAHQSVLIAFHLSSILDWQCAFSSSDLVETGIAQSRLFVGIVLSTRSFARQPITMFLSVNPSRSSFLIAILLLLPFFTLIFS